MVFPPPSSSNLTGLLALELTEHSINVNCVVSQGVWTPMYEKNAFQQISANPEFKGTAQREYFENAIAVGLP